MEPLSSPVLDKLGKAFGLIQFQFVYYGKSLKILPQAL